MKKTLVSMVAVLATTGIVSTACAGDCSGSECKAKKYRVIRISASEPETSYTEHKIVESRDTVVAEYPEYRSEEVRYEEPVKHKKAKREERVSRSRDYNEWYVGARVGADMLSWKNKYKADPTSAIVDLGSDNDKYTFETVFGGGVFIGHYFTENWHADIEYAYMTQFTDSSNGITFKLSTPYLMGNVYYDFDSGFYLGGGLGLSFSKATMEWEWFTNRKISDDMLGLSGALMAGYAHHLSDSLVVDFRYRLAGFYGPEISGHVMQGFRDDYGSTLETLTTDVGFIIDNAFSIGLRYEF